MKIFTLGLLGIFLGSSVTLNAQNTTAADSAKTTTGRDSLYKNTDFEHVTANVFTMNSTAPQSGLLVGFSKKPYVRGLIPVYQGNMSAWFIDATVTSNNEYNPIFERGKWATNATAALSYTLFIDRDSRFDAYAPISSPSYVNASQIFWGWINAKGGYNLTSHLLYKDQETVDINEQISRRTFHNIFGQVNFGFYLVPFKQQLSWLHLSGNLGFEYRERDNNYAALQTVRVKTYDKTVAEIANRELEVTSEETSAKQGNFVVANSANLNYALTVLINREDKYIFALNFFGKTRLSAALRSTDLGAGVSFPIRRTKNNVLKTVANLGLTYEVIDFRSQLSRNLNFSDKGFMSLNLAIPIYTLNYK